MHRVDRMDRTGEFIWSMIDRSMDRHPTNRKQAVPLITSPEEYPYWKTSKPLVVPRGIPQVRAVLGFV